MIATSMGDDKLTAIDIKTETPAFEIPLPGQPRPLVIDPETRRLYVQLSDLHGFIVVDLASRKVVNKVLLPDGPPGAQPLIPRTFSHGIGIAPDGKSLWVTSLLDDSVSVFSLPDLKRLGTTHVGNVPDWMTFSARRLAVLRLQRGLRCRVGARRRVPQGADASPRGRHAEADHLHRPAVSRSVPGGPITRQVPGSGSHETGRGGRHFRARRPK